MLGPMSSGAALHATTGRNWTGRTIWAWISCCWARLNKRPAMRMQPRWGGASLRIWFKIIRFLCLLWEECVRAIWTPLGAEERTVLQCCGEPGTNSKTRDCLRPQYAHYRVQLAEFGTRRWPIAPDQSVCSVQNRTADKGFRCSIVMRHCIGDNVLCGLFSIRAAL